MTQQDCEVTADEVRGYIIDRQRELLEQIIECYEQIAAWQKKADSLHRELHSVPTAKMNEWLGGHLPTS